MGSFLGNAMLPNSQERQTLLATRPCETEPFTLNLRQTYDSMQAIVPGKAQLLSRKAFSGQKCIV